MIQEKDFKLIGIRPHKDCDKKFIKLLEPGRFYQFYNEYHFFTNQNTAFDGVNGKIHHYELIKTVPHDLYKIGNLNVNISAVVGKNGTGKSTLIELLFYSIYIIGTQINYDNESKLLKPYKNTIQSEIDAHRALKSKYDELVKSLNEIRQLVKECLREKNKIKTSLLYKGLIHKQNELNTLNYNKKDWIRRDRFLTASLLLSEQEHDGIIDNFKCDLFFSLGDCLFELKIDKDIFLSEYKDRKRRREKKVKNFNEIISCFFYTIFLNYSHHSLNSNYIGDWINTLFHKNDGYKTPAVINPMRVEGNFDINTEIDLAKVRLLTNLLIKRFKEKQDPKARECKTQITEKQYIQFVSFKFDKTRNQRNLIKLRNKKSNKSSDYSINGSVISTNLILDCLSTHDDLFNDYDAVLLQDDQLFFAESLLNYIAYKVPRILKNYPEYGTAPSFENSNSDSIHFYRNSLINLKNDNSHVTFKYHRTVNFLRKILDNKIEKWTGEDQKVYYSLDELLDWMEIKEEKDLFEINRRIPPPIFDIDFIFEDNDKLDTFVSPELDSKPKFSDLSSGEQQSIHTINALIYHLNNAYSVHKKTEDIKRTIYGYYNVIFDEIELYFHPDLQRKFIDDLLKTLEKYSYLVDGNFVRGLNVLFSTHSPFILSDIPEQNILQLNYGFSKQTGGHEKYSVPMASKRQTFGANIHDLLSNSFFLSNSFKGEHAQKYFISLIDELDELEVTQEIASTEYSNFKNKIGIVAEPFIRAKLFEKLDSKFEDYDFLLDEKIKRSEAEIEALKKEKKRKNDSNRNK